MRPASPQWFLSPPAPPWSERILRCPPRPGIDPDQAPRRTILPLPLRERVGVRGTSGTAHTRVAPLRDLSQLVGAISSAASACSPCDRSAPDKYSPPRPAR